MRILVVDDEPNMRLMFRMWLAGDGREIEEVSSGEEALERLGTEAVDVLVLDYMLRHGIDGLETAAEVRRRGTEVALLVICSAYVTADVQERAAELGADVFEKSDLEALSARIAVLEGQA